MHALSALSGIDTQPHQVAVPVTREQRPQQGLEVAGPLVQQLEAGLHGWLLFCSDRVVNTHDPAGWIPPADPLNANCPEDKGFKPSPGVWHFASSTDVAIGDEVVICWVCDAVES